MRFAYIISDIPPSNNQFIGRNKRWQYQDAKKHWADLISLACRPKPPEPLKKCRVHLHYMFPDKRRRDPDNYSGKFILDGLVKAGILEDDNFTNIQLILSAEFGGNQKQTLIEIEEVQEVEKQ